MPDDGGIRLRDDDRAVSMTYAELAAARQISKPSAERLVRMHKWARTMGNDGKVRVLVPLGHATPGEHPRHHPGDQAGFHPGNPRRKRAGRPPPDFPRDFAPDIPRDLTPDFRGAIEAAVSPLRDQLDVANRRAEAAEQRADAAEHRADRVEQLLVDARVAEKIAAERVKELEQQVRRLRWWRWRRNHHPSGGEPATPGAQRRTRKGELGGGRRPKDTSYRPEPASFMFGA
jgi:hypothetical protein